MNLSFHLVTDFDFKTGLDDTAPPFIVKPTINGLTSTSQRYSGKLITQIFESADELKHWRLTTPSEVQALMCVQNFRTHDWVRQRLPSGMYGIERWLWCYGTLVVGIRISTQPVIKQWNSITSFFRNPARCGPEEFQALCEWIQQNAKAPHLGLGTATFSYHADSARDSEHGNFWASRNATLEQVLARMKERGMSFDFGSMDITMDASGVCHVFDVNYHTMEDLPEDLAFLLERDVMSRLRRWDGAGTGRMCIDDQG